MAEEPEFKPIMPLAEWKKIDMQNVVGLMKPFYMELANEDAALIEVIICFK